MPRMTREQFQQVVQHERSLAAERDQYAMERKPSAYKLKKRTRK